METTLVDNAELVRNGYEAFARGDVPAVLETFAPDIEWTIPGPHQVAGTYRGPAAVGGFFEKITSAYDLQAVRPDEVIALDADRVLVLGAHVLDGKAGPMEVGFAHLWRVRDGKAVSFHEWTDTERIAQAIG